MDNNNYDLKYLRLLADKYPNIEAASTEIINLSAILNLPKGTEHFLSDVHGEDEAFLHVLNNGSGSVRRKIDQIFHSSLMESEKKQLATLIYYPQEKLLSILKTLEHHDEWFRIILLRLVKVVRVAASKYTRSRVRRQLPPEFAYIIEELLHEREEEENKQDYFLSILDSIISTGQAAQFVIALSETIQKLIVARLHIIGDIYDRGPGAHIIMEKLMQHREVDIQWGNHDILWMGAAAGSTACIANVLRVSLRYNNLQTLENGYGISLLPLATFAMNTYAEPVNKKFMPIIEKGKKSNRYELTMLAAMHKAITVIQLKLEGQVIQRRPEFQMENRLFLDKLNLDNGTVKIDNIDYPLTDSNFPTLDTEKPYELTVEEQQVIHQLQQSFKMSHKLQQHTRFLYAKGSAYLKCNGNLLYHGCIPMPKDGQFKEFTIAGKATKGKAFFDHIDIIARQAYFGEVGTADKAYGVDTLWYLWSGSKSPLFGKDKMAVFESYFTDDKAIAKEHKNPYYEFRDQAEVCSKILKEFGLDPSTAMIINGHVPVMVKKGESPLKADGKLIVIDGGFSKAYQSQTGIAGYTLVSNSHGIMLCAHEPFESKREAIESEIDIHYTSRFIIQPSIRLRVRNTDRGEELMKDIDNLKALLDVYRKGLIKETRSN